MKQCFLAVVVTLFTIMTVYSEASHPLELNLTEAGTFEQKLEGINLTQYDSLIVRGPMNREDCQSLCVHSQAHFFTKDKPRILSINLSEALFPNDSIPACAFWTKPDDPSSSFYNCCLRAHYIDLPSNLRVIGDGAFEFAQVNHFPHPLPKSVRLGEMAFAYARFFFLENFLPEGLEDVPYGCFAVARFFHTINTPSTLKRIGDLAFSGGMMTLFDINLNEGLEEIGEYAFYAKDDSQIAVKELIIPSTCLTLNRASFRTVITKKLVLPEGLQVIPPECFMSTINVNELTLPKSLRYIGDEAFSYSLANKDSETLGPAIKYLEIPEGVYYIGVEAFRRAGFDTFKFPSTTRQVGCGCLKDAVNGDILIAASTPPECIPHYQYPQEPIFRGLENHILYVPVGAAEAYRQAPGWCEFKDIREDPELKDSSVTEIWNGEEDAPLYDLSGRIVTNPCPGQICICHGRKVVCR